ncbi:MAG: glycosyltransferase [Clostridia bacterium]|nr:glycosyltransferase [Clostridia bacterium]
MSAPLVAEILGDMNSGGVESVVTGLLTAMDARKLRFRVFLHEGSAFPQREALEKAGIPYTFIPKYTHAAAYVKALEDAFRADPPAIVHSHLSTMAFLSLYAAKRTGVPVRVLHNHSTAHAGEGKKTVLKNLLRPVARHFATHWFACGDAAARWMYGDRAVDAGKVTVLPNAVDAERFAFDKEKRKDFRAALGIPDGTFVVGHIGRFCYQKNHERLLTVFSEVLKQRPDSVLLLIGEGERFEDIRRMAETLPSGDRIRFPGVLRDTSAAYSAFDAFVLPSWYEGLPVVGVEAQFNGVPCVFSSNVTAEIAMNGNAVRLPLDAPDALWAEKILSLGRTSPAPALAPYDVRVQAANLRGFYLHNIPEDTR